MNCELKGLQTVYVYVYHYKVLYALCRFLYISVYTMSEEVVGDKLRAELQEIVKSEEVLKAQREFAKGFDIYSDWITRAKDTEGFEVW